MALDPQSRALLARVEQLGLLDGAGQTVGEARKAQRRERVLFSPSEAVADRRDVLIAAPTGTGRIPIRVYTPMGDPPFGVACFLHGGGWVLGGLNHADRDCRALANASGCVVASIGYRLAPEHPFPAALEDSYAALCWVSRNSGRLGGDGRLPAVVGDSAGGNLAAATTLLAHDRGGPEIGYQVLIYPILDSGCDTNSYAQSGNGYWLTSEAMRWFWSLYAPSPADAEGPLASPLKALDLAELPPALILTAEYDVLRDEGEAYGKRLRRAGVPVRLTRYDGMIHGFWSCGGVVDRARAATEEVGRGLRDALTA